MINYDEKQLKSLRVAELREIADSFQLEYAGLRKDALIQTILDFQSVEVSEAASSDVIESDISDVELTDSETIKDEVVEEAVEELDELIEDSYETAVRINQLVIKRPTTIYKDAECRFPEVPFVGVAKVFDETEKVYQVTVIINGRGPVSGFIKK